MAEARIPYPFTTKAELDIFIRDGKDSFTTMMLLRDVVSQMKIDISVREAKLDGAKLVYQYTSLPSIDTASLVKEKDELSVLYNEANKALEILEKEVEMKDWVSDMA